MSSAYHPSTPNPWLGEDSTILHFIVHMLRNREIKLPLAERVKGVHVTKQQSEDWIQKQLMTAFCAFYSF